MYTLEKSTEVAAGCIVVSGQRYINTDIAIEISDTASVVLKTQLASGGTPITEGSAITATGISSINKNYHNLFITWSGNNDTLKITVRQYNPVSE